MDLELDEILFSKTLKFLKWRRKNDSEIVARKVVLNDIKPRLTLIARALCASPIEIYPAEREGGYKDDNFFLPTKCFLFSTKEENFQYYIFRIFYLSIQKQMDLNGHHDDLSSVDYYQKAIDTAPKILKVLFEEYPQMQDWYDHLLLQLPKDKKSQGWEVSWLYGKWMKNSSPEELESLKNLDDNRAGVFNKVEAKTSLNARAVEEIESLIIDKKQQEDYVMLHNFEKIESAEEFNGNWRDFDGTDDLEEHQDALEEMNMKYTVRVDDTVHSVYQADFVENTSIAESAEVDEKGFHLKYDEWDYKKNKYLVDFCKIYPKTQVKSDAIYYKNTITRYKSTLNHLRKMLANVNNRQLQVKRQIQGEHFDLDALTDLLVDVHSKISPDERVYITKRKKEKDIAILLLLDLSLSSDGYAAGRRVIDVEKEVSILFGEILNEYNIDFAIDGFYSKTRHHTSYLTMKEFNDDWNSAKLKIGAVEPSGYTRIGAALRHGGVRLDKISSQNKWIILLSDGKPNDYDKYEGQHGLHDVKQALRELNKRQINSYALAIESQAKYYLPQMFGLNHYQILSSTESLLQSLTKLYDKIKNQ
ncbi:MAG: VWA domain-containing protein [Chitinophagales bacterium]|nr:VWA domain-containing protein [Chitinophagales bacterium]MCZ2393838.1 VWA domain-containing protein [Chitinophagales bacterium]